MIKPTIGRVVWYWPIGLKSKEAGDQPCSAQVAYVHNDRMINIGFFDHNGHACAETSVVLVQEGDEYPNGPFATWMPYQMGQAAKTEQLQQQVAAGGMAQPSGSGAG